MVNWNYIKKSPGDIIIINLELDEGDEFDDGEKKLISGYVVHAIFIASHICPVSFKLSACSSA